MRIVVVLFLMLLTACAPTGPDPRDGFSARNIGQTVVTFVEGRGTQVVHMAEGGTLYLWSSARSGVQTGNWRYDVLATGAATSFQGAGGINFPVQELETDWRICFRYLDDQGQILRRPQGGDWNCALFPDYEALVIDRATGDAFGLATQRTLPELPQGARLDVAGLRAL